MAFEGKLILMLSNAPKCGWQTTTDFASSPRWSKSLVSIEVDVQKSMGKKMFKSPWSCMCSKVHGEDDG